MSVGQETVKKGHAAEDALRMEQAVRLAGQVMQLARDNIVVNMRFLDVALSSLIFEPSKCCYTILSGC